MAPCARITGFLLASFLAAAGAVQPLDEPLATATLRNVSRTTQVVELEPREHRGRAAGEDLYTLLHYYDHGQHGAEDYLRRRGAATGADCTSVLARCRRACVRVDVRTAREAGSHTRVIASGVLVQEGRRVVTAGHGVEGLRDAEVTVTLSDGRRLGARVLDAELPREGWPANDWAVLELESHAAGDLPWVPLGRSTPRELALILGYPDRIGLDERGRAAHGFGRDGAPLDPVLFVGRVSSDWSFELDPLAGSIPLGGASGAPVFNVRGELLGVLTSVGLLGYPDGIRHTYRMSPTRTYEGCLARR